MNPTPAAVKANVSCELPSVDAFNSVSIQKKLFYLNNLMRKCVFNNFCLVTCNLCVFIQQKEKNFVGIS